MKNPSNNYICGIANQTMISLSRVLDSYSAWKFLFAASARGQIICSSCGSWRDVGECEDEEEASFYFRRESRARWRRIELPLVSSRTLFKHYRRPPRVRYSQSGWFGPSNRESLPPSSYTARICAGKGEILLRFFLSAWKETARSRAIYIRIPAAGSQCKDAEFPQLLTRYFHNVLLISKAG